MEVKLKDVSSNKGCPVLGFSCLFDKVLVERQQQIELNMQKNREAQEESLKRREELIKELEWERKFRRREKEQEEGRRTARMQEINAQVGYILFSFLWGGVPRFISPTTH